jgi:hypothetical protein
MGGRGGPAWGGPAWGRHAWGGPEWGGHAWGASGPNHDKMALYIA